MVDDDCGAISGMNDWQGKLKYWEETCPSAAVSTTDPTRLSSGRNAGRYGVRPVTTRLSYGSARPAHTRLSYGSARPAHTRSL
jgi:hypothetical protein